MSLSRNHVDFLCNDINYRIFYILLDTLVDFDTQSFLATFLRTFYIHQKHSFISTYNQSWASDYLGIYQDPYLVGTNTSEDILYLVQRNTLVPRYTILVPGT
jgi:hypothetical protein